jgi:hypothetical protein
MAPWFDQWFEVFGIVFVFFKKSKSIESKVIYLLIQKIQSLEKLFKFIYILYLLI